MGAALALLALLAGCASAPHAEDPRDPWEGYNRGMTNFNNAVDGAILKPVATIYQKTLPRPARTGVSNFFGNLSDVWSLANNVLQVRPQEAMTSFWRVALNTTLGLCGVLDPATDLRLPRTREDFGQTLGYWGVPSGPYLVLPILGPSTLRDTVALPVDWYGHPLAQVEDVPVRNWLHVVQFVDIRSQLLGVDDLMNTAAPDTYAFTRDAYLQKRLNDIYNGAPPQTEERYDLDEQGHTLPVQSAPAGR